MRVTVRSYPHVTRDEISSVKKRREANARRVKVNVIPLIITRLAKLSAANGKRQQLPHKLAANETLRLFASCVLAKLTVIK